MKTINHKIQVILFLAMLLSVSLKAQDFGVKKNGTPLDWHIGWGAGCQFQKFDYGYLPINEENLHQNLWGMGFEFHFGFTKYFGTSIFSLRPECMISWGFDHRHQLLETGQYLLLSSYHDNILPSLSLGIGRFYIGIGYMMNIRYGFSTQLSDEISYYKEENEELETSMSSNVLSRLSFIAGWEIPLDDYDEVGGGFYCIAGLGNSKIDCSISDYNCNINGPIIMIMIRFYKSFRKI